MNKFEFIGTIIRPKELNQFIRTNSKGYRTMKLIIRQNETNSAYVQLNAEPIYKKDINVRNSKTKQLEQIPYERRFDEELLKDVSYSSKIVSELNNEKREFICKSDFIDYIIEELPKFSPQTLFRVAGEYVISEYKGKLYNNFNIKSIKNVEGVLPEFKMSLDLYYNNESLDESDKKNKFLLNAYLSQYSYSKKTNEFIPIQVQFITNRYDFKNEADVEIIRHRKANMKPTEKGYVKAIWEAQYVRGAQMIVPPLETLPKDIQFEIKHAGRDISEYQAKIVGEAKEFICLTRPNNTLNKDGAVFTKVEISDEEFKSKIIKLDNENHFENTLDNIAKKEAQENPFND